MKSSKPHPPNTAAPWSQQKTAVSATSAGTSAGPSSLEELCTRLRRNETTELSLGWKESDFLSTNKRCASLLQRALKNHHGRRHDSSIAAQHTSVVESLNVGWRHKSRIVRAQVLKVICETTRLKHVRLVLNDWLPEQYLVGILAAQPGLETLELQAVQVKSLDATGRPCCDENKGSKRDSSHRHYHSTVKECDHCVVSRVIVNLHRHHDSLKVLRLIDCEIDCNKVKILSDFFHLRGGISELSLRSNRKLGPAGISIICRAPVVDCLDLSLCDMGPAEARAVGMALPQRSSPLGKLLVCGNYRMGQDALLLLVQQECADKVMDLNASYCDVSDYTFTQMMQSLEKLKQPTALVKLHLQGSHVGQGEATQALAALLSKDDCPLRTIRINDPQMPKRLSPSQLGTLLGALTRNYELEDLEVDFLPLREERALWKELDYQLRLNRAGRRILCHGKVPDGYNNKKAAPTDDWFDVLGHTQHDEDLDVLFWLLRESAGQFDRQARQGVR